MTVHYKWKTIQTGRWDSIKGDHNRLIEVKIILIKGKEFRDFDRVIQGGR